jgi:signal transduction histidine kinase/ActR/RegA family two-component response regulator
VGHELQRPELHARGVEEPVTVQVSVLAGGTANAVRAPEGNARGGGENSLSWQRLRRGAQLYVAAVIGAGAAGLIAAVPLTFPQPAMFASLILLSCITSIWKVNLPIPLASGSTLSVSYAADLMALLLLGPRAAVVVAVAGVWAQCTFKVRKPYPTYRTVFSMAAESITMAATGFVFVWLGGPLAPSEFSLVGRPLVAAIGTYFVVNTGLVAGAIALSSGRSLWRVWHDEFLWSGASFMVAGSAGAAAAVVIARGEHWKAVLLLAPVYLTYRTYQIFVGRLEDQKRHTQEMTRLHQQTVEALSVARRAEHALAEEKERLAVTVAELTRLEATRLQLLERERAARASAEEGNRLKDQFLAMVSHELRTPLNAILGWSDMLRRNRIDDARRERACEAIYDNARRQARLIDELLDVARIVSGKLRLERTAVDLEYVVHSALEIVQAAADAKQLRVIVETESAIGTIYGDASRLQQIAWNLLSNAVKFTPEGGTVHVRLRRVNNTAEMIVSDDGSGIPPEFLPWVFEPFRQADASTTRPYGGLGLGLSIVKHLVEAHGGTIEVESGGEGRGATFTVRMPVVAVVQQPEVVAADRPAAGSDHERSTASLRGISVLVVDDDDESREVIAAHLESHDAVVLTATSSEQAIAVLQRERVDVLLADIAMPGEDGYTLIRKLRATAETASIPAAALTALARDEDRHQALSAGFQLHLAKPVDADALVAAVASLGKLSGV